MNGNALELLKQILEIPSVNSQDNEGAVAEFLADYFKEHGIQAEVQKIDDTHANVIAFVPGKNRERTMIWNGHLDTVPYGSLKEWQTDPAKTKELDGKLYARGSSDMKSGLAAMAYALCHLDGEPACNIQFLGTCDEEKGGLGAEMALKDGKMADGKWILVGEPTGMRLGIAQKGCLWLEISAKGFTSHGAYPKEGANAVSCAVRIADQVKAFVEQTEHSLLGSSTAQITMIDGGVANNMTPDQCRVVMDIRMVPGLTSEQVIAKAKETLAQLQKEDPRFDASFCALNDRRAIEIDAGHPMTEGLGRQIKEAGYEGALLGLNFFTDASVLDRKGERDILLFGPGEPSMAHQPNEYVEIKKYEDAIRILQNFAKECGQE